MILRIGSLLIAFGVGCAMGYLFTIYYQSADLPLLEKKTTNITEIKKKFMANLFFTDKEKDKLGICKRELLCSNSILGDIKEVVEALVEGPQGEEKKYFLPTIPKKIKLRAVFLYKNCAYLDFSKDLILKHPGGSYAELQTIYSIVNTLITTFPNYIDSVQFLIEGEKKETLAGHISIFHPLSKNLGV
jgi:spore germination protein GerM